MALSATVVNQIRDEVGDTYETGVDDDTTLETIYDDSNRGNSSVLKTALIVWKNRLANAYPRSFDVTTAGLHASRSQTIKFMKERIAKLEFALSAEDDDAASKVKLAEINSNYEQWEDADTELS